MAGPGNKPNVGEKEIIRDSHMSIRGNYMKSRPHTDQENVESNLCHYFRHFEFDVPTARRKHLTIT